MPPFSENLPLSSSDSARALSPNPEDRGQDVLPSEHAFEVGVHEALGSRANFDVAHYRKSIRSLADVDQFLDTTVTFPLSWRKAWRRASRRGSTCRCTTASAGTSASHARR